MAVPINHCGRPGLFWCDADQETARADSDPQGLDGIFKCIWIFEYVVHRKVIGDDIKRTSECSLPNITLTQKPYPKIHGHGSILGLLE